MNGVIQIGPAIVIGRDASYKRIDWTDTQGEIYVHLGWILAER